MPKVTPGTQGDVDIASAASLFADRTRYHKFLANQFRLLLSAAAYVLVEAVRRHGRAGTHGRAVWGILVPLPAASASATPR